ncbi:hypothetical protein AVEN_13517-1 [Araneus ventricosus]|uniref:Cuticle protein 10.9 n=1 Tax=Araneus ventricosus TaxID=182803 RepID=A0A4Y2LNL2_ARAVE|nr:hypothetical protein AVEN_13517-1 [Araneus ventricosus]
MVIVAQTLTTAGISGLDAGNYRLSSVNDRGTSSASLGFGSSGNNGGNKRFTSSGYRGSVSSSGFLKGSSRRFDQNKAPKPYKFNYQSVDEQGHKHYYRQEADGSGAVRGSYRYTDVQGLYLVVNYIADASGFRARIRTNEPGTDGKEGPADVQMTVEKPPAGIQDRYTMFRGTGGLRGTDGEGAFTSRMRTEGNVRNIDPIVSQNVAPLEYSSGPIYLPQFPSPKLLRYPPRVPPPPSVAVLVKIIYKPQPVPVPVPQPVPLPVPQQFSLPVPQQFSRPVPQQFSRPLPCCNSPPISYISPETNEERDEYA